MTIRDQNGNAVFRRIRLEEDGTWACNVWWGGLLNGFATNLMRYHYRTRREARDACISDLGENALYRSPYLWESGR